MVKLTKIYTRGGDEGFTSLGSGERVAKYSDRPAAYGVVDKVLMPEEPVKMMRMRGDDHDVVGYGHFSETRKVALGPHDKVMKPMPVANDEEAFDEYTMREMEFTVKILSELAVKLS